MFFYNIWTARRTPVFLFKNLIDLFDIVAKVKLRKRQLD